MFRYARLISGGLVFAFAACLLLFALALWAQGQAVVEPVWIKRYEVEHDGMDLIVEGYMRPGTRIVTWEPSRPFNRRALANGLRLKEADRRRKNPPQIPSVSPPPRDMRPQPVLPRDPAAGIRNFGIDAGRTFADHKGERERVTAETAEARRFVEQARGAEQATDTSKLHLTVIGSPDLRAQVVNDLKVHPALAALAANLYVQDYAPGDWPVDAKLGFRANGAPTILIQQHGGRVVWRANDYSMGPTGLAEAIRKADPNYRPEADPGPANGVPGLRGCPLGFTREHWPAILFCSVVLLLILARTGRKDGR